MNNYRRFLLIISIIIGSLFILTSCDNLVTKVETENEEQVEVTSVDGDEDSEEIEPDDVESVAELQGNRYAIIMDGDLSRLDENMQTPADPRVGDVVFIDRIEEGVAFVEVIGFLGDAIDDYSVIQGYIPLENLILNPTEEDYKNNALTFHIKPGTINGIESVTNREVEILGDTYTEALESEDNQILIPQAGGAHSVWVSKDDVDFDFSGYKGNF